MSWKSNLICLIVAISIICCRATTGKIDTNPSLQPVDSYSDPGIRIPSSNQYLLDDFTSAIVFVRDIQKAKKVFSSIAVLNSTDRNWELGRYLDDRLDMETQTVIESRLQKLKHLNIIRSFSKERAVLKHERDATESGDAFEFIDDQRVVNHIIALELTRSMDMQRISSRQITALYKSEISFQVIRLENDGATVIESGVVEGRAKRHQIYDLRWDSEKRQISRDILRQGETDFDVQQARLQATCRASLLLVDKLSRSLPISAKIASHTRDNFKLDIGNDQGVVSKQVFAIYTVSGGKKHPFALGEVVRLDATTAEIKIFKWSEGPYVKRIVDEFKAENGRFETRQEYYAVSLGLPNNFFAEETCLKKKVY